MVTPLDVVLILFTLLLIARGAWVGLIRQLALLAALIFGFLAAGHYFASLSRHILPFIKTPTLAFLLTYVLLFGAVYLLVMVAGLGLKKVVQISLLSWFDRLMGGLFGLGKAYLLVVLLFLAISGLLATTPEFLQKSFFFPIIQKSAAQILPLIKDEKVRERFLPRPPAIPVLLPDLKGQQEQDRRPTAIKAGKILLDG